MFKYVHFNRADNVDIDKVYQAFQIGFSDYMIEFQMSKEDFIKRFFGPEGNQLENSFIALDGDLPIGVILGGVKMYEGIKTLRCGTLAIHPDYRGMGVSKELFRLHKEVAIKENCKQLFLEVIVGNDRAIKFYKNLGYEKVYDISYFTCTDVTLLAREVDSDVVIEKIDFKSVKELSHKLVDIHVNWQNDFDYMSKLEGIHHYGIHQDLELIGFLSVSQQGKIYFIHVCNEFRHLGYAHSLLSKAVKDLNVTKLTICFPNNANLEGFVKSIGFTKDKISQYEMYLPLR